jgi:2-polyprenyl-3-methyl-5-hydroxy-6-metoxy-1,4-benzoquinol methylase
MLMTSSFFVTTSWDDGAITDIKLAQLLLKYNIPATFYIPLRNTERKVITKKEIKWLSENFEIGGHSLNHLDLTILNYNDAVNEVSIGKKEIEQITGKEIKGFCYPKGEVDEFVKQIVGLSGFQYARTTELFGTMIGDKLLIPTTVHAYDHHPGIYAMHGLKRRLFYNLLINRKLNLKWEELALASLEYCIKNNEVFHLWGHSWEIDKNNDWNRLEYVLKAINKKTAAFQRGSNGDMIKHVSKLKNAYYQLQDAKKYNSSFKSQYFRSEFKLLSKHVKDMDKKNKKVLDVGCGTGRLSGLFKNADYMGIDTSKNFIKFAKKRYSKKLTHFNASEYQRFIKSKKYNVDLLLFWGVFEDEANPLSVVEKMLSSVKKDGKIIFTLHNYSNFLSGILTYIKTEWLRQNFPYTTFPFSFLTKEIETFASKNNLQSNIFTFGLLPPFHPTIPAIRSKGAGNTIIVVLKKND